MAKQTVRANRAKLLRALPHALWGANEDDRSIKKKSFRATCLRCKHEGFCLMHDVYWTIRDDAESHYLAIALNDANKVSFASKKPDKNDEVRRVKLTFARYIRRQLGITEINISDAMLAEMQARLVAATKADFEAGVVRILRGEEVRAAYREALGFASCMTGPERTKLLDMYVQNPDHVGLLVFEPKSGLQYRALIWELDNGKRYLDRIYPSDKSVGVTQLVRWAKLHGVYAFNSANVNSMPAPIVTLPNGLVGKYPYLDTFRYGRWADESEKSITWRSGMGSPILSDPERRKHWPLYVDGNTLQDLSNAPIPCAKCRKPFIPKQLRDGPDHLKYCSTCMELCYPKCVSCGKTHWYTDMDSVIDMRGRVSMCKACAKASSIACVNCLELWVREELIADSKMCPHCDRYCKQQAAKS